MKKFILFLIISLLLVFSADAEIKWKRRDLFDFSGGLNDGDADLSIKDNEASSIQNIVLTSGGNIKTRSGYDLISGTVGLTTACTGGVFYKQADGTKFLVSIWEDDKIRKMEYGVGGGPDGTWDDITGAVTITIGQNDLGSFAVGEDELLIEDGDGSTAPFKWTGAGNAADLGGGSPDAKYVVFHKNMAFAAGDDANSSTLYFSDLGDIDNWATGLSGNVNVETDDGSVIRAIVPGFDALYIWKDHSIWRLSGNDKDTFVLQRMVSDIGTLSGKSIGQIGNDFIFVSDDGDIILYDGAVKVRNISAKIQGTIDGWAFDRIFYTPAVIFDDDYYIGYSTVATSTNSKVLLFDTFYSAWTKFDGLNVNAIWVGEDANGKEAIFFGDYIGNTYQYPSGTDDNGTAISDFWVGKQFRFPELTPEKDLKLVRIFVNEEGDYNLCVEIRTDYSATGIATNISLLGTSSLYDTAVYGTDLYGGQNLIISRIEPDVGKNFFQFKFFNENADEPWELKGMQLFLEERDRI